MTSNKLRVLDLFSSIGGFTVAGDIAGGYETVAFCEIDKHARKVLRKNWPDIPIFDDVTKLKVDDINGTIDVITGGFPCQDISIAGKGAGIKDGTRSGLFREMLRLACEVRQKQGILPYIIFENVPRFLSGPSENAGEWFGEFLWSLAEVGYDAEWICVSASDIGAPHKRERICVIAYANESERTNSAWTAQLQRSLLDEVGWEKTPDRLEVVHSREDATYDNDAIIERRCLSIGIQHKYSNINSNCSEWSEWGGGESEVCGVDDGFPKGSHSRRNGLLGNAIVPQVFAPIMIELREFHQDGVLIDHPT